MAETTRTQQLKALAAAVPGTSSKITQGLQGAREAQLQETIRATPAGAGPRAAGEIGAQQQAQAGQINLQGQARTQQALGQVGQIGLQQQQAEAEAAVGAKKRGLSQEQRRLQDSLRVLGRDVKNQLLDAQLEFKQDEAGRTLFNQRQLVDYAAANARSQEEYLAYAQDAQLAQQRKIQLLEMANKKLMQVLSQGFAVEGKRLHQATRKQIAAEKIEMQKRIE